MHYILYIIYIIIIDTLDIFIVTPLKATSIFTIPL